MFIAFLFVLPLVASQVVNGFGGSVLAPESIDSNVDGRWIQDTEGNWIYIPPPSLPDTPVGGVLGDEQEREGGRGNEQLGGQPGAGGPRSDGTNPGGTVVGGVADSTLTRSPSAPGSVPGSVPGLAPASGSVPGLVPGSAPVPSASRPSASVPGSPDSGASPRPTNIARDQPSGGGTGLPTATAPSPSTNINTAPSPNTENVNDGNRNAAGTPDSTARQRSLLAAILVSTIGSLLLLSALVAFIYVRRRHRNQDRLAEMGSVPPAAQPRNTQPPRVPPVALPVQAHVSGTQHAALPPMGMLPPIPLLGKLDEEEENVARSTDTPATGPISTIPLTIPVAQRLREREQQTFAPPDEVEQEFMQDLYTARRNTSTPVQEKVPKEEIQVFYVEEEVEDQVEMLEVEEEEEEEHTRTRGRRRRVFEEYLIEDMSGSAVSGSDVEIVEHVVDEDMDDEEFHEYLSNLNIPRQPSRPPTGS